MARSRGANAVAAIKFEITYGTAPTGNFANMPFSDEDLGIEQDLIEDDLLGNGREPFDPVYDMKKGSGTITLPVCVRNIGYALKLMMGAPVTVATVAATAVLTFTAQPAAASTITLNGTAWTFVATGATGNQVNIGVSLAATLTALQTALAGSSETQTVKCTYAATSTTLTVTNKTLGPSGNAYTVAASNTSNASTPYGTLTGGANSHTFTTGGVNLPSASIEIGNPEVPSYRMNTGVRGGSLKISLATSGLLNSVLTVVSQNETPSTTSNAGTPTVLDVLRLTQFSGEVTMDGTQLAEIVSADDTLDNKLETIDVIRPDGLIEDADAGVVANTGQIVTRFATTTLLDKATSATPVALGFTWTGKFGFSLTKTVFRTFLPKAKVPVKGPTGIQITFPFQASKDPIEGCVAQYVLVNDVTGY